MAEGSKTQEVALSRPNAETSLNIPGRVGTVAVLAKSLSDENRLRILMSVSKGKKSVSSIVEELGLSQPLISHHLKELKRALLVNVERNGPFIYYELADRRVLEILENLDVIATDLLSNRRTF